MEEPKSPKQLAIEAGEKTYKSNCKKHGECERYVSNCCCILCLKEFHRKPEQIERCKIRDRKSPRRTEQRNRYQQSYKTPAWREKQRAAKIKCKYNITLEQCDEMRLKQNNRCGSCGEEKELVIDHCHATGKVRGLLCSRCNLGLGHFNDDIKIMKSAILYLEKHACS